MNGSESTNNDFTTVSIANRSRDDFENVICTGTTIESNRKDDFNTDVNTVFKVLMYAVSSIAFVLNLGVFYTIVRRNNTHKLQFALLASLSFSDMIIALLSCVYNDICFFAIWLAIDDCDRGSYDPVKHVVRWILSFLYTLSQFAGLIVMYAITMDVMCAVYRPLYYRHCKLQGKSRSVVVIIWSLSFTVLIITVILSAPSFSASELVRTYYFTAQWLFLIFSAFSFIPISIMYSIITCKICCHVKRSPSAQIRSMRKSVITMLLIIGTYFVCMMPYVWIVVFLVVFNDSAKSVVTVNIFHLLFVFNTLMDPIIYALRIPEVRQGLNYFSSFRSFRSSRLEQARQTDV